MHTLEKLEMLLFLTFSFLLLEQAGALKCYECNSMKDPKCGSTWELSKDDAAKYVKTCDGNTTACRKLESSDSHHRLTMVIRSCWNNSLEVVKDFYSCHKMTRGIACYCKNSKEDMPCNQGFPLLRFDLNVVWSVLAICSAMILSYV